MGSRLWRCPSSGGPMGSRLRSCPGRCERSRRQSRCPSCHILR
ncbi:unnamed protein product [Leptidea sinapis]|uniref:Uncharacterized protein n=1 Tax=Leptidea sinapis TaxID=189913 RepID=A0A5E4QUE1_9NEOP|nr:unnamed protein product [Leptidea sinapis]